MSRLQRYFNACFFSVAFNYSIRKECRRSWLCEWNCNICKIIAKKHYITTLATFAPTTSAACVTNEEQTNKQNKQKTYAVDGSWNLSRIWKSDVRSWHGWDSSATQSRRQSHHQRWWTSPADNHTTQINACLKWQIRTMFSFYFCLNHRTGGWKPTQKRIFLQWSALSIITV